MVAAQKSAVERVKMVYPSSAAGADEEIELPFRLLVLGNFTRDERSAQLDQQKIISVNNANLGQVIASLKPSLTLSVSNHLSPEDGGELRVDLTFTSLDAFAPDAVVAQIPFFKPLIDFRNRLSALLERNESSTPFAQQLLELFETEAGRSLFAEAGVTSAADLNGIDEGGVGLLLGMLDERMGRQLDAILHAEDFSRLESIWRSLQFLVERTDFSENCSVEIFNISKQALTEDFEDVPEITDSGLYHLIYTEEFGQFGGKPFSAVIADFYFDARAPDVFLMQQLAAIGSMSHAPVFVAPKAEMFDVASYSDLPKIRDMGAVFAQPKYAKYVSLRNSEDAKYIGVVLPRFLLREPYSTAADSVAAFPYQESFGKNQPKGVWGNAVFALATRLMDSFARLRWCTNIVGDEDGRVAGLEMIQDEAKKGFSKIPTEVLIPDRRETELVENGFIVLSVHKQSNHAAFYAAHSIQAGKTYADHAEGKAAELNYKLGSQMPYLFIICRIAHYIKMMQRENIGSWKTRGAIEREVNAWLKQYVTDMDNPAPGVLTRRPLRRGKVEVEDVAGKGDWFLIRITVVPHLKYMGTSFMLTESGKLEKS